MLSQYSRQNVSLVWFVCVMAWGWIVIDMILGAVIGDGLWVVCSIRTYKNFTFLPAWNVVVSLSIIKIVWFTNPKTICSTMDFSCGRAPACFMNCHVEECSSDLRVGLRQASHVEECRGCPAGWRIGRTQFWGWIYNCCSAVHGWSTWWRCNLLISAILVLCSSLCNLVITRCKNNIMEMLASFVL